MSIDHVHSAGPGTWLTSSLETSWRPRRVETTSAQLHEINSVVLHRQNEEISSSLLIQRYFKASYIPLQLGNIQPFLTLISQIILLSVTSTRQDGFLHLHYHSPRCHRQHRQPDPSLGRGWHHRDSSSRPSNYSRALLLPSPYGIKTNHLSIVLHLQGRSQERWRLVRNSQIRHLHWIPPRSQDHRGLQRVPQAV